MKALIILLMLAATGWAQETEDQELQRLLKLPDPPVYVAPVPQGPTEVEILRAENAKLKAEAQQASYDKWMASSNSYSGTASARSTITRTPHIYSRSESPPAMAVFWEL